MEKTTRARRRAASAMCTALAVVVMVTGTAFGASSETSLDITDEQPLAAHLPQDVAFVVEADVTELLKKGRGSRLAAVFSAPGVAQYLRPMLESGDNGLQQVIEKYEERSDAELDHPFGVFAGRGGIAVLGGSGQASGDESFAMFAYTFADGVPLEPLRSWYRGLIEEKATGKITTTTMRGLTVNRATVEKEDGDAHRFWGWVGRTLIDTENRQTLQKLLDHEGSLRADDDYAAVARKLNFDDRACSAYVDTDALLRRVLPKGNGPAAKAVRSLKLRGIKGAGYCAGFRDGLMEERLYLHMPDPEGGLLELIRPEALDTDMLDAVPPNADRCILTRMDAAGTWNAVLGAIKAATPRAHTQFISDLQWFKNRTAIDLKSDLLQTLGSRGLYVGGQPSLASVTNILASLGRGTTSPAPYIKEVAQHSTGILELEAPDRVQKKVRQLLHLVVTGMRTNTPGASGLELKKQKDNDMSLYAVEGTPDNVHPPAVAFVGNKLVMGPSRAEVRRVADRLARKRDERKQSELVAALRNRVPSDTGVVSMCDAGSVLAELLATLRGVARHTMSEAEEGSMTEEDDEKEGQDLPEFVRRLARQDPEPMLKSLEKHLGPQLATASSGPDGLMFRGRGPVLPVLLPALASMARLSAAGQIAGYSDRTYRSSSGHFSCRIPEGWKEMPAGELRRFNRNPNVRFDFGFRKGRPIPYMLGQVKHGGKPSPQKVKKYISHGMNLGRLEKLARMIKNNEAEGVNIYLPDPRFFVVTRRFDGSKIDLSVMAKRYSASGYVLMHFYLDSRLTEQQLKTELAAIQTFLDTFSFEKNHGYGIWPEE